MQHDAACGPRASGLRTTWPCTPSTCIMCFCPRPCSLTGHLAASLLPRVRLAGGARAPAQHGVVPRSRALGTQPTQHGVVSRSRALGTQPTQHGGVSRSRALGNQPTGGLGSTYTGASEEDEEEQLVQQEEQEQEEHPGRRSMPQPLAVQPAPQEPGGSSTIMSGSVSWLTSEFNSRSSVCAPQCRAEQQRVSLAGL